MYNKKRKKICFYQLNYLLQLSGIYAKFGERTNENSMQNYDILLSSAKKLSVNI